jgi:hypothetical protein
VQESERAREREKEKERGIHDERKEKILQLKVNNHMINNK